MNIRLVSVGLVLGAVLECVGMGDGGARLRGQIDIQGNPAPRCTLALYLAKPETFLQRTTVSARFEETFVIAPKEDDYYVEITCDGGSDDYRSEPLRLAPAA